MSVLRHPIHALIARLWARYIEPFGLESRDSRAALKAIHACIDEDYPPKG